MTRVVALSSLVLAVACATADPPGANPAADAATGDPDAAIAPGVDAAPGAPDAPPVPAGGHLLLSELVLAPTAGELIEIYNPTDAAVDLSSYYLADAQSYFELPSGAPTVDASDFIVQFPAGSSIAGGGVATIALSTEADFMTTYGSAPTFSIGAGANAMTSVAGGAAPTLTNAGEGVVLFRWDGTSDVVADVDMMHAGAPTAANSFVAKTGVSVDGPDADATGTAYASDALTLGSQAAAPDNGESTKRIAPEAGNETQAGGGNGLTGDDETSEAIGATWDAAPFSAPTPGSVPASLSGG